MPTTLLPLGHPATDFRLLDQQGRSLGLKDGLRENGLVLLFFSSFWLPGDLKLLKQYATAYPEFQQAGIGVMAISGINWETLHHLAKRLQSPFPLLFDPCCRQSKYYQTMLIPKFVTGRAVYGINPAGQIILAGKKPAPSEILNHFTH